MTKKRIKYSVLLLAFALVFLFLSRFMQDLGYDTGLDTHYTSPLGSRSILLRYDFVSRPTVFSKGKQLFSYAGSGFAETVAWDVVWNGENQITLSYDDKNDAYDEVYTIIVP